MGEGGRERARFLFTLSGFLRRRLLGLAILSPSRSVVEQPSFLCFLVAFWRRGRGVEDRAIGR